MFIPRIIPCLLLNGNRLVKTIRFKDEKYIGDVINAVKIFNEKEVDELIILDIKSTIENKQINFDLIKDLASECFMPLCYGGGIKSSSEIEQIFKTGVEKVALNTSAHENSQLIAEASKIFGSQSVVVSIDVKKNLFGKYQLFSHGGRNHHKVDLINYARQIEDLGAGEILLNSIDRDGTRDGYDLELINSVSHAVDIPVIACGGAGQIIDFKKAFDAGASAAAAGSFFVLHGKHQAVLITYPTMPEIEQLFISNQEELVNEYR